MYQPIRTFFNHAFSPPILPNSMKIALVVGSILNAINQGERFFTGNDLLWTSLLLNYLVPFCVASYSAARLAMHRADGR